MVLQLRARDVFVHALKEVPAEVDLAGCAGRQEIDLLPGALSDVADPQVAGQGIKGEAPGVAQTIMEYLIAEGIIGWDGIRTAAVHIDAQELAKQGAQVLPIALRVTA